MTPSVSDTARAPRIAPHQALPGEALSRPVGASRVVGRAMTQSLGNAAEFANAVG